MNTSPATPTQDSSTPTVDTVEEFRAGVTATLRSWSALRAAVESGWGGVHSQEKAEELRQHIYDAFDGLSPKMDQYDLEDNLAIYMEEQFSVVLEDDSERQVASVIYRMFEECLKGDVTLARQTVESAKRSEAIKNAFPVHVQSTEDDDDDDDDMDTTSENSSTTAQEYAAESLFGKAKKPPNEPLQPVRQLGEAAPAKQPVEIDDDGFATVPTKRRNQKSS